MYMYIYSYIYDDDNGACFARRAAREQRSKEMWTNALVDAPLAGSSARETQQGGHTAPGTGGGGPDTPGGITGAQDQAQWSWRPDSLRAWMACTHMIFQHSF